MRFGTLAVVTLVALPSSTAMAGVVSEKTSTPFPGIKLVERVEDQPNNRIFAAYVSLCEPYVHMRATKPTTTLRTPGGWASGLGIQLATNGDFFKTDPLRIYGDAVGGGIPWPFDQTGKAAQGTWYYQHYGWIAFGDGWVEFNHTGQTKTKDAAKFGVQYGWYPTTYTEEIPAGTQQLVSGFPELVIEGQQYECSSPTAADCFPDRADMHDRNPRTAMGITEDRSTFILVAVEGRNEPTSYGMYGSELARLMKDLGAWEAFNIDGGGSTAMWLEGKGYLNAPSDGVVRAVGNQWGVYAGADSGMPEAPGSCFTAGGCFPTPLVGAEDETFKDLPASMPGHDEVLSLYDKAIAAPCSDAPSLFYCPKCGITRADFITMLVKAKGLDVSSPPATPTFSDVPADSPSYAYVEAAAAAGFALPCEAGKLCPDANPSRAEAAKLVRLAMGWAEGDAAEPTFTDVPKGDEAFGDVEALVENCAASECDEGSFCPGDALARADAAIFVAHALEGCEATTGAGGGGGGRGGAGGSGGQNAAAGAGQGGGEAGSPGDGGGCSCGLAGHESRQGLLALFGLALAGAAAARRRVNATERRARRKS